MVSPLQSFRSSKAENRHRNKFASENQSYPQINTERQACQARSGLAEEFGVPTYRSESYVQDYHPPLRLFLPDELIQQTPKHPEDQSSSESVFEPENISFISQNTNPSKNLARTGNHHSSPEANLRDEPEQSKADPRSDFSGNLGDYLFSDKATELLLDIQKDDISSQEIHGDYQLEDSTSPGNVPEELDIAETCHQDLEEESLISPSDTQGCMEICITPPLSSDLVALNNFFLPEDKEESQNDPLSGARSSDDLETPEKDDSENLNRLNYHEKRRLSLSSLCPKFLNCLFPWIRSEQYFEDNSQPIFYFSHINEESQKLVTS